MATASIPVPLLRQRGQAMSASCSLGYPKQLDFPYQSKLGGGPPSHHQFNLECMTKAHQTGDFQHPKEKQHVRSPELWYHWKTL